MKKKPKSRKPPVLYVVVRGDLQMPTGKLAAQVGHAVAEVVEDNEDLLMQLADGDYTKEAPREKALRRWKSAGRPIVVLRTENELSLTAIYNDSYRSYPELPAPVSITDAGRTFFSKPTTTCVGIGPLTQDEAELLDLHVLPTY